MIFMNLDSWNALSDDEKAAVERAAIMLEQQSIERFDQLAESEKQELLDLGMEMTSFSEAEAAQFEELWSNGVWTVAEKTAPEEIKKLRGLAQQAGLSN